MTRLLENRRARQRREGDDVAITNDLPLLVYRQEVHVQGRRDAHAEREVLRVDELTELEAEEYGVCRQGSAVVLPAGVEPRFRVRGVHDDLTERVGTHLVA